MNPAPPASPIAPGPRRRLLRIACAFALGALAGVCAHYLVYRLSLPSTPFIYVAF